MNSKCFSRRFDDAMLMAVDLHRNQFRKGKHVPYIAHLLAVTALVIENGGDEDQAIASLLHDAVEDQGGIKTLNMIRERFGERVAEIVDGCTDTYQVPKPPWRKRKERYLEHLKNAPFHIQLVSLADKVHNAYSILSDLRQNGETTWDRFNGGKDGTLWYYRSLLAVFQNNNQSPLVSDLARIMDEIEKIVR